MTAKEFAQLVLEEVKEGKTDTEILRKLIRIEGAEHILPEIDQIRSRQKTD